MAKECNDFWVGLNQGGCMSDCVIKISNHCNTNAYLIDCDGGKLLFDTGEEGSFSLFLQELDEKNISVDDIKWVMFSHFHEDHVGFLDELMALGVKSIIFDMQEKLFQNTVRKRKTLCNQHSFVEKVEISESRKFLHTIGILGEVIATPGHSEDSISLYLDSGSIFVGDLDLRPLFFYANRNLRESVHKVRALKPKTIYFGHGMENKKGISFPLVGQKKKSETYFIVKKIMKCIDKGENILEIQKKTGANMEFIEDVNRMYLTHQNVGVQGILDRIEIKNK